MTKPLDTLTAIRTRRTIKAISEKPQPATPVDKTFINTLLEAAYWAPFHYPTHNHYKTDLTAEHPFRFYVLASQTCRHLAQKFDDMGIDTGKVRLALNTTHYMIVATWTPQPSDNDALFEPSVTNMEHIAAAGAGIQNLLLAATALGHENYWGSGGVLRQDFAFDLLGIPKSEILLGSLFLFPSENEVSDDVSFKFSPRRDTRGGVENLYRWVTL